VSIPTSLTSISDQVFFGCTSLSTVTLPNSITSIGYQTFAECASLSSVTIPDSVISIGDFAFAYITNIHFTVPSCNSITFASPNHWTYGSTACLASGRYVVSLYLLSIIFMAYILI
jgi:hypothetical protein